jgi:3-oxoacyl-[acyl-carrier-protein] synthase III
MPGLADVIISGIAYRLGERSRVDALPLGEGERARLLGPDGGLRYHCVSQASCFDLAVASARETLAQAAEAVPRPRVDAVIVASMSLGQDQQPPWIDRFLSATELDDVPVCFFNGGDCLNFQLAARLASGLCVSSPQGAVLLVCVDRVADACPGRYLAVNGAGISSDATASCLFSLQAPRGFRLAGTFAYAQDRALLGGASDGKVFAAVMVVVQSVFRQLYEAHGLNPRDIGQVISNTHTNAVAEIIAMAGRVPLDVVFRDNIPMTAHCFAADNLINLSCYAAGYARAHGPVVLIGSGVHQWGGFVVEPFAPQESSRRPLP